VLIDRPFHPLDRPEPEWGPPTAQDLVNALPKAWSQLQLVHYEDTTGIGDWQQTREDRLKKQALCMAVEGPGANYPEQSRPSLERRELTGAILPPRPATRPSARTNRRQPASIS